MKKTVLLALVYIRSPAFAAEMKTNTSIATVMLKFVKVLTEKSDLAWAAVEPVVDGEVVSPSSHFEMKIGRVEMVPGNVEGSKKLDRLSSERTWGDIVAPNENRLTSAANIDRAIGAEFSWHDL